MRVALAALANEAPRRDIADTALTQLEAQAGALVDDLLGRVRAMLDRADSLEQFRHLLDTAYPTLDEVQLTQLLRLAMTAADLGGRADVIDGD
jgi:phage gp29-like protein